MANKTLSTSTLSLKFMQNAQRAKQLKEVELERAEVKDDGKWEVSQVVRQSWETRQAQPETSKIYEESYMPFLFSSNNGASDDDDTNAKAPARTAVGRRTFNKKGQEMSLKVKQPEAKSTDTATPPDAASTSTKGRKVKVHPKPVSISASGTSGQLRGFDELEKPQNSKTARQAIFESSGVGIDLRAQARIESGTSTSTSATFLKPAGVDDPKDVPAPSSALSSNSDGIITSTRQKKVKRVRDDSSGDADGIAKKQKKKKKKNPE
ncbi:hypothetical protein CPC08DRAFT_738194 [Agrocybe pediades]|nr:hypothetical protein CPC08DRAFT_738194 [Agrocybe pediades]